MRRHGQRLLVEVDVVNKLGFWLGLALAGAMVTPAAGCIGAPFDIGSTGGSGGMTSSSSSASSSGSTTCTATQVQCPDGCFDTVTDKDHCGDCTTKCKGLHECVNGNCVCPPQDTDCSGICANTNNDPNHCGDCNTVCMGGKTCQQSQCKCPSAKPDFCSGTGTCVDLQNDANNCGTCGKSCSGTACVDGQCTTSCPGGTMLCGNKCVDLNSDADNCSTCNKQCAANERCTGGSCVCAGATCGNGACPAAGNALACGGCTACNHPEACYGNNCDCRPELLKCSGNCIDPKTDPTNCGSCGNACNATEVCIDGQCKLGTCLTNGAASCSATNTCLTTTEKASDPLNCGSCGNVCAPDKLCFKGACHQYFFVQDCSATDLVSVCGSNHKCCPYTWNGQTVGMCFLGDTCPPAVGG